MQNKFDTLISLIQKSGLKLKQQKLAYDIIADIVAKYNIIEGKYNNRIKQQSHVRGNFYDYYDRVYNLLILMNITEVNIGDLNYNYIQWIKKALDDGQTKDHLTYDAIKMLENYLGMYEILYDRLPVDMPELKQFIKENK